MNRVRNISFSVLIAGALPALLGLMARFFTTIEYLSEPLHAFMEVSGGATALVVAFLLAARVRDRNATYLLWCISALCGMGLLDIVHGAWSYGMAWSWLRALGTALGGSLFALVWVKAPSRPRALPQFVVGSFLIAALLITIIVVFRRSLPAMWHDHGGYTLWTKLLNTWGAAGFVATALFFYRRYAQTGAAEDLIFAAHAVLFAVAGFLIWFSRNWHLEWWLWHALRLGAYCVVTAAAYDVIAQLHRQLRRQNIELESHVAARTTELQRSKALFQSIAETTPDLLFIFDVKAGRTVYCNAGVRQVLGYSAEEFESLANEASNFLIHPDDFARVRAQFQEIKTGDRMLDYEHRSRHKDGSWQWLRVRARVFERGPAGELQKILGVATNVTEAKMAAEQLRESEEQLRFITDHVPVLIVQCDRETRYKFVNLPYAARFDLTPSQVVGKRIEEIMGAAPYESIRQHVQAVLEGQRVEFEERILYERMGARWMHCVYVPDRDAMGKVDGFVAVIHDVTKRREAENAWRENETVLRTVTDGARVGLVMVNEQRRYLFANEAYAEILGLASHNIVGKRVAEVLPAVYDQIEPRLARAFRGERVQYELRVPGTAENPERFYDVIYEPRAHEGGDPYVVVVIVDVTERKQSQQNLEDAVAERTSKLREAISELEAFSYSIAHDMRAPLRGMQGFAHVLQEDYSERLDDTGQQYLARIIASAERLDRLIRDVLHYSKVSRGELPLERVNLGVLTREIIESYPQFKDPKVTIQIEEPLPTVVGNPASLTQVISNLLSNAVKFVAPGTAPHVRVWSEQLNTSSSGHDSQTVRLWFEDNGIGIPVEAQNRLFQIFQRVHRPEVYEGTGIGLAVVRKAVERLGGKVGVQSEPGKGSRFWLELKDASGNGKPGPEIQVTRFAGKASSPPRP